MRDLVVTENVTLDGVIDADGGWFDPAGTEERDFTDVQEALREQMSGADAVLLGRETYTAFEGFWPEQTDDPTGVADYLNRTEKYVVSGTLTDPSWENTTVLSGPLEEEVAALKRRDGRAVVATGSVSLVQALTRASLVDEFRLFVYPVVVGQGRRLFEGARQLPPLRLVEARPFRAGVVLLRYRTGDS